MENKSKYGEDIERRTYKSEVITRSEGESRTVTGYAALYNSETQLRPGIYERIAPGAFRDAVNVSDIRALLNHDPNHILGRMKAGTLRVWEDDKGLAFELDLPESRSDVLEALRRGDIDQCSFAFTITDDGLDVDRMGDGSKLMTITKVERIYDVTIATYPAYEDTSVSARTKQLLEQEQETVEDKTTQRNANILKLVEASTIY